MHKYSYCINIIWRALGSLLLLVFLLLTINWLIPSHVYIPFWPKSTQLKTKETVNENGIRIDYLNENGLITLAADKNYATVLKIIDDHGNCIMEEFFDENGNRTTVSGGYSAIRKEYDNNDNPIKMEYLDQGMNLVISRKGYAEVLYTYDKNGKVETEMYFDNNMQPVRSTSDWYGVKHEYTSDGKEHTTKGLDAEGNLMTNTNNYVIASKTYDADGKLHTVMYYDEYGNPFKLINGAYGYLYRNRKTICLDSGGNEFFVLSHFLNYSKACVILIGATLLLLILLSGRIINGFLLVAYLAFILYMTILNRNVGNNTFYLAFPPNAYLLFTNRGFMMNIWLFIPLGAILYKLFRMWEIIAIPMLLSLVIETAQIVFGIGFFELADLIANPAGGIIGTAGCYVLEPLANICRRRIMSIKEKVASS